MNKKMKLKDFYGDPNRVKILIAGRRSGKTTTFIDYSIKKFLSGKRVRFYAFNQASANLILKRLIESKELLESIEIEDNTIRNKLKSSAYIKVESIFKITEFDMWNSPNILMLDEFDFYPETKQKEVLNYLFLDRFLGMQICINGIPHVKNGMLSLLGEAFSYKSHSSLNTLIESCMGKEKKESFKSYIFNSADLMNEIKE